MKTLIYQPVRASILIFTLAFATGFATERALDSEYRGAHGPAQHASN